MRNDGRPPDTIRQLIGKDAADKRASTRKKARVVSPTKSQSKSRSPSKQRSPSKSPTKARSPLKSALTLTDKNSVKTNGNSVSQPLEVIDSNKNERTSTAKPSARDLVSYPLYINSCWLDTTLEVLYRAFVRNPRDLQFLCSTLHVESPLRLVIQHLADRHSSFGLKINDSDISELSEKLTVTRNTLRRQLVVKGVTRELYALDELWVSCIKFLSCTLC